jgi:hypothetical protein
MVWYCSWPVRLPVCVYVCVCDCATVCVSDCLYVTECVHVRCACWHTGGITWTQREASFGIDFLLLDIDATEAGVRACVFLAWVARGGGVAAMVALVLERIPVPNPGTIRCIHQCSDMLGRETCAPVCGDDIRATPS